MPAAAAISASGSERLPPTKSVPSATAGKLIFSRASFGVIIVPPTNILRLVACTVSSCTNAEGNRASYHECVDCAA